MEISDVPRYFPLGQPFDQLTNYCCYKSHRKYCAQLSCSMADFDQLSCLFENIGEHEAPIPSYWHVPN